MTLKWIRRWARFLDVKLRLDHTLSQSTDKLRSDNSLFQIVLIERGFVMQSIILLYIKETDGRPADGAIQSRIGWEEIEDAHGTPYALRAEHNWRKTKYADAGRQNLVLNVWNEQRPWLSYISPHMFTPKEDQEGWTNGQFPHTKLKLCHKGVLLQKLKGPPVHLSWRETLRFFHLWMSFLTLTKILLKLSLAILWMFLYMVNRWKIP